MKGIGRILAVVAGALVGGAFAGAHAQTADASRNYIMHSRMLDASGTSRQTTVKYYDGFGRPEETVAVGSSPSGHSLVSYSSRDRAARIISEVVAPVGTGAQFVPYADVVESARALHGDNRPYGTTFYEQSPFGRVQAVTGAGQDWYNAGKAVTTEYYTNEDAAGAYECLCFDATGIRSLTDTVVTFTCAGRYAAGTLFVTQTTDEDGHLSMEFKDKEGHTVLQRRAGSLSDAASRSKRADTYYVYDNTGHLTAVLPPLCSRNISSARTLKSTETRMRDYCYFYIHDDFGRIRATKQPGSEWTVIRRDAAGQVVYSQNGNMRRDGQALLTLSDALGRPCVTAVADVAYNLGDGALGSVVLAKRTSLTVGNSPAGLGGYLVGGNAVPTSGTELLKAVYYDNYDFLDCHADKSDYEYRDEDGYDIRWVSADAPALSANGLRTGSLTRVLGTDRLLLEAVYYDNHGNVIQRHARNDMGGADHYYYHLTFTGKPLTVKHVHVTADTTVTEVRHYQYDHAERLMAESIERDGTTVPQVRYSYDELGRSSAVRYGQTDAATVTTGRNVRGWTTSVSGPMFSQTIHYQDSYGDATACWNGNVSAMEWTAPEVRTAPGSTSQYYAYGYDGYDRLVSAKYVQSGGIMPASTNEIILMNGRDYSCTYTYDLHGNVTALQRKGIASVVRADGETYIEYGDIDNLTLKYKGNRLKSVTDAAPELSYAGAMDFRDGVTQSVEYTYDANGNMTSDLNKGIRTIRYNVLNLPRYVEFTDGHSVTYTYDADGNKLRTVSGISGVTISPLNTAGLMSAESIGDIELPATSMTTREYCGGRVYVNGRLERILTSCGYTDSIGKDYYYVKDYLGNVRTVVDGNGSPSELNSYYPYGALMNTFVDNQSVQPYKYGAKELDRTAGLDLYDSQARHYDPILARTTTVDPQATSYYPISPYAWCAGNPVRFVDPDGQKVFLYATTLPESGNGILSIPTHTFLVVKNENVTKRYAFGSEYDGIKGAFDGRLKRREYEQDILIVKGENVDKIKIIKEIEPPKNMTSEEFDNKTIEVAESFGNNPAIRYKVIPNSILHGNCNTSTSTILLKAGVSPETIKEIRKQIPGIVTGFDPSPRPWTAEEQEQAIIKTEKERELNRCLNTIYMH